MRCFYHGEVDAVAICKSCGHGLCHDCSAEVGTSSACRNRCESDFEALNDMIQRNKTSFQKASGAYVRNGIFITLLGTIFAGLGALRWGQGEPEYFLTVLGVVFIFFGVSQFGVARRWRAK